MFAMQTGPEPPIVGFLSPPDWYDPAPSEFPTVVREEVRIQQTILPVPGLEMKLKNIAAVQDELGLAARTLAAAGCGCVAQVGTPYAWAGIRSEARARSRSKSLQKQAGVPVVMTGLAIVDALQSLGITRLAVNCTYYDDEWQGAFTGFLEKCGFKIAHTSTYASQRLIEPTSGLSEVGWSPAPELTRQSILTLGKEAPEAEAIVVAGSGTRTLALLRELENLTRRPVIAADTVLYWAAARILGLTLLPTMGTLARLK